MSPDIARSTPVATETPVPTETPVATETPVGTGTSEVNQAASSAPMPPTPSGSAPLTVVSAVLALRIDENRLPIDPTLAFRPGEKVNLSVRYSNIAAGVRLGIRWLAGDSVQGSLLTDPQPAYEEATYGFWFELPKAAPVGPWRVELLDGSQILTGLDFSVLTGSVRSVKSPG